MRFNGKCNNSPAPLIAPTLLFFCFLPELNIAKGPEYENITALY